jgi:uncharacterized protein Yka (UPF0111/DUF47 family)
MKYLKKFEKFSINEEFVSEVESQNIKKWSNRLQDIEKGIHELRNEIEAWSRGNQYEGPGQQYHSGEVVDGKIERDILDLIEEAKGIIEMWHRIDNDFENMSDEVKKSVRELFSINPEDPIMWPGKIKDYRY